jgi:hypothetical protein
VKETGGRGGEAAAAVVKGKWFIVVCSRRGGWGGDGDRCRCCWNAKEEADWDWDDWNGWAAGTVYQDVLEALEVLVGAGVFVGPLLSIVAENWHVYQIFIIFRILFCVKFYLFLLKNFPFNVLSVIFIFNKLFY